MTQQFKHWLPQGAFCLDAVGAVLAPAIEPWSTNWFARKSAAVSSVRTYETAAAPSGAAAQSVQVFAERAAVQLPPRGKRLLLDTLLALDLSQQILSDGDRRILDHLASQVLDDLGARIDKLFEAEPRFADEQFLSVGLALEGRELLVVTLPEHILIPRIKARLTKTNRVSQPLRKRLQALAGTKIVAEAVLGRADLAMNDLESMAVGDVVVLDRDLSDAIDLHLSGSAKPFTCGRLVHDGEHYTLQL